MKLFRIILLFVVGLGIAWAQGNQSEGNQSEGQQPVDEQSDVEQLSQEELDAEMQRMEEALDESGLGESDEVVEFIPTKPLAADLPVALPSDI
jgi:hypothetical protein